MPGPVGERPHQLGLDGVPPGVGEDCRAQRRGVVDEHVWSTPVGMRIVGEVGVLVDQRDEVVEPAVGGAQPRTGSVASEAVGDEQASWSSVPPDGCVSH